MKINEVSKITGVSIRTLHYYDKIGILVPTKLDNGYRIYSKDDLNKLQKILFYKYLNFRLSDIANILKDNSNSLIILEEQHKLLLEEKKKIENIIKIVERVLLKEIFVITIKKNWKLYKILAILWHFDRIVE